MGKYALGLLSSLPTGVCSASLVYPLAVSIAKCV